MAVLSRKHLTYKLLSTLHIGQKSCLHLSQSFCYPCRCQMKLVSSSCFIRPTTFIARLVSKTSCSLLQTGCHTIIPSNSSSSVKLNFDTVIDPDVNIEKRFENLDALEKNVRQRKINLDVKQLYSDYGQIMQQEKEKIALEIQRRDNADLMKLVVKEKGEQMADEKAELIKRGKLIKEKLKQLQSVRDHTLYKKVTDSILKLPVDLHPNTPLEDKIIVECGSRPEFPFNVLNHMTLGQNTKFLQFTHNSENTYYLLKEAALLEHHLLYQVIGNCLKSSGLQRITCPDLVKAFVVEGCGFDLSEVFEVASKATEDSRLEMSGDDVTDLGQSADHNLVLAGVSILGFAAYLTGVNIHADSLPLKYYSIGRSYSPVMCSDLGLYSVSQANSAALFGAAPSSNGAGDIFDEYLSIGLSLYKKLDLPFRVVEVGASNLRFMESKRTDFYIWSAGFNRYFKSGEIRLCSDYISRRLSIRSDANDDGRNESKRKFVHTVDGIVIQIPTVIASLMEHFQSKDGTCAFPKFT